jgi:hypothetical protein
MAWKAVSRKWVSLPRPRPSEALTHQKIKKNYTTPIPPKGREPLGGGLGS